MTGATVINTAAAVVAIALGLVISFRMPARAEPPPTKCLPSEPASGPGIVDPFHTPAPSATQLNADGKVLYRRERWDEARAKYRAAEASDPEFLAPALNVACSFVRQERFADAMLEVRRLVDRAFLPWSTEVLAAADLGALKVKREGKELRAILEAARERWTAGLLDDVVLVARVRPPLKLGDLAAAKGALVLGPRQEVFAWSPRTLRYRQLTSEEGRVLAVARSSDGRRIAYVTAEKLIPSPGREILLRGVVVTELDLGSLAGIDRVSLEGDLHRLDVLTLGSGFAYRIDRGSPVATFRATNGRLEAIAVPRTARAAVTLTGRGVDLNPAPRPLWGGCPGTVRDLESAAQGSRVVQVRLAGGPARSIGGPLGSSLSGLPIP